MRTEAKAGDWPWHVALLLKKPLENVVKYDCGGNIISRTAVLTGKNPVLLFKKDSKVPEKNSGFCLAMNFYKYILQIWNQASLKIFAKD